MKKTLLALSAFMAMGATGFAQLTENFESTSGTALPASWTLELATGATASTSVGWNTGTNTTLGVTGFPFSAHTRFVAVNDKRTAGSNNSASRLVSPTFTLGAGLQWLKFDCSYVPNYVAGISESAKVQVSTDGGTTWITVSTLTGNVTYWWEPRNIDLSTYAGMSIKVGFLYSDNSTNALGWGIDNIATFSPPANELELVSTAPTVGDPAAYGLAGTNVSILGQVKNNGGTPVSSYNVKYVFNGGSVVTNTIAGTIAPFATATFTATTPVALPATIGAYPLRVWIEYAGDADNTNDSAGHDSLYTVGFMPVKRMVAEEGTGTWCQWCPRGAVYMDSLATLHHDEVSLIAVHNNDPMEVTAYDAWMGAQIGGYPSAIVDRRYELDPDQLIAAYNELHDDFAFADITAVPTFAGTSLTAAVTVRPATAIRNAKLAWVITEDQLSGTTSAWNQSNAYSGYPSPMVGGGYNFNTLPNPVPASIMKYNHVARSIDPSPTGSATALPASMAANTDYTYTINKTLDATWVTNKLHGVVMLLGSDGSVLNSANFTSALGISDVAAGIENVLVVPNPATSLATVIFDLKNTGNIQLSVFDVMGRIVYSLPSANLSAGTNRVAIPVADFANGMYHVKINTEAGTITEKFNVIK